MTSSVTHTRRYGWKLVAGIAVLALLAVAVLWIRYERTTGPARMPASGPELQAVSFRLKWITYSSFAHHFVANDKGFFAAEGLRVTIHPGGAGIDPIKLVAANVDDVGLASYAQILLARSKGVPVVAIAEEYVTSGVVQLALKKSGITKPSDFVGKRVGVIAGSDTGTVYEALMLKLGIDRKRIQEVPIGFDLGVLLNGTVDVSTVGYVTNQPIVAREKGFEVNVIDPKDYGIDPGGNVLFTSEATLRNKRDMLVRFLRADLRGILRSQQMDDRAVVDIVLKNNDKLDPATELKVWDATKNVLLSDDPERVGLMPEETWAETARLFQQFGGLDAIPPLHECYTNDLVREALRSGVR